MSKIRPLMHGIGLASAITMTSIAGEAALNGPEDCVTGIEFPDVAGCIENAVTHNENQELLIGSMVVELTYLMWALTEASPATPGQMERQKRLDK